MPISTQQSVDVISIRRGDDSNFLNSAIILKFEFPKASVSEQEASECKARFQIETVIKDLTLVEGAHTDTNWVYEANLSMSKTDTLKLTPGPRYGWLKVNHDAPGVAGTGTYETSSTPINFYVLDREVN